LLSLLRWSALGGLLAVAWLAPRLGDSWLARVEQYAARPEILYGRRPVHSFRHIALDVPGPSYSVAAYSVHVVRLGHLVSPILLPAPRIVKQLEDIPGKHLVIVRYAPDHFADHEWVYNDTDIDASKIVWAREIPTVDMAPLLEYFRDRKVWLVQADHQPQQREEYRSAPGAIHAGDNQP